MKKSSHHHSASPSRQAAPGAPPLPQSAPCQSKETPPLLELLQDLAEEILEAQRDEAVPVMVVLFENVRHAFQRNAALHEQVEAHDSLVALVVRPEEQLHELGAQAVAEGDEGVGELLQGDVAAAVDVEAIEEGPPRGEEGPEAAELVKVDGPVAVRVEHADHHPDRLDVERGPVAVDEGRRELPLGELSCSVLVHCSE